MDRSAVDYLVERQCSTQWKDFLGALAVELSSQLDENSLCTLMRGVGVKFASQHPLPPCETVIDMQHAMSSVWDRMRWGRTVIAEQDTALQIVHLASPLHAAFGDAAALWASAFLEGVYQQWFVQLGASDLLHVKQIAPIDEFGSIEMSLAQK